MWISRRCGDIFQSAIVDFVIWEMLHCNIISTYFKDIKISGRWGPPGESRSAVGLGDKEHFFDPFIDFPVPRKAFWQHKAVARTKAVHRSIGVYHAAATFQDVAKLYISGAV